MGQGGGCGHEHRGFTYHNSFLVADPSGAFVLETAGRRWAAERVTGARTISNALTLEPLASEEGDRVRSFAASARRRRACTQARAERAGGVDDMMSLLRDHDAAQPDALLAAQRRTRALRARGRPRREHADHRVVGERARAGPRAALGAPARPRPARARSSRSQSTSPSRSAPRPRDRDDGRSLWWRHERLHRRVLRDPRRWQPALSADIHALESRWHEARPSSADAFAEADAFLEEWTKRTAEPGPDRRPWWARRFWAERSGGDRARGSLDS